MATIVTRSGKGSPLTNTEVDANFTNLNNDKLETSAAYVHPNHSGEVTSSADGATVIADNVVDADNLKVTGNGSTSQFLRSDGDGTFTWATPADTDTVYTHPNHSGEVTSSADGATVIADGVVDEANLKVSNSPTNGYFLSAQSGNTGGLTWAAASGGGSPDLYRDNAVNATTPTAAGDNGIAIGSNAVNTTTHGSKNGLAIGTNAVADYWATALGAGTDATGNSSLAVGYNSQAIGTKSTAIMNSYASGTDSFAAAIAVNTSSYGATGANSVAIGYRAKATGQNGAAIGGTTNTASGSFSFAAGPSSNVASGMFSVAIGDACEATTNNAFALGHDGKSVTQGKFAYGSGKFSTVSDAQTGTFVLRRATTDATATQLTTNNGGAATTNQIILPNNSAYSFSGTIVAREQASAGSDYASWEIKGALLRDANAASTVLGNGIQNKMYATSGASAWAIALTADTTNGGLKIEVTGAASTNIRWVATVNTSEVTY